MSVLSLSKQVAVSWVQENDSKTIAAVNVILSSDHVFYETKNPELLDWLGFLGGISVTCFLVGKFVNQVCFRKKYVSPMMDYLFQV